VRWLPLGDPSILAVHALARAAARDGTRVLLSGEGADELFLGYRRYRALAHHRSLPALRRFAPQWSMRVWADRCGRSRRPIRVGAARGNAAGVRWRGPRARVCPPTMLARRVAPRLVA